MSAGSSSMSSGRCMRNPGRSVSATKRNFALERVVMTATGTSPSYGSGPWPRIT
jgi:hypothetical protein